MRRPNSVSPIGLTGEPATADPRTIVVPLLGGQQLVVTLDLEGDPTSGRATSVRVSITDLPAR